MLHIPLVPDDDDRYWPVRSNAEWGLRGLLTVRVTAVSTAHRRGLFFHTSDSFDDLFDTLKGVPRADRVDDEETFTVTVMYHSEIISWVRNRDVRSARDSPNPLIPQGSILLCESKTIDHDDQRVLKTAIRRPRSPCPAVSKTSNRQG